MRQEKAGKLKSGLKELGLQSLIDKRYRAAQTDTLHQIEGSNSNPRKQRPVKPEAATILPEEDITVDTIGIIHCLKSD